MGLFLTIDAGGTSTRALVHDAAGTCLGHAVGSGGNPTASGVRSVAATMRSTAAEALDRASAAPEQVQHALAAMAGSAAGMTGVDSGLRELGIGAPLTVGSDLEAMFFSGTASLDGVGLVAGTGAAAVVLTGGSTTSRSDGRGWLLGDVGSGYWIARRVMRAVTADLDRRGPRTSLTPALLAAAGVAGDRATTDKDVLLDELVRALYAIPTPGTARFAPLAFDHAAQDEIAADIVDAAARGLAHTVESAGMPAPDAPLIVGGSVLFHQPGLRSRVAGLLREAGWSGQVSAVADGTVGAITMNLRGAGVPVDAPAHERITVSLKQFRADH